MDKQEAIKRMESIREYLCAGNPIWDVNEMRDVFELAISALQEQDSHKPTAESVQNVPKEDLISRNAAIDAVEHITSSMSVCVNTDECHGMKRMQRQAVIELANLPSAQPESLVKESRTLVKDLVKDTISRQATIDALVKAIRKDPYYDTIMRAERRTDE